MREQLCFCRIVSYERPKLHTVINIYFLIIVALLRFGSGLQEHKLSVNQTSQIVFRLFKSEEYVRVIQLKIYICFKRMFVVLFFFCQFFAHFQKNTPPTLPKKILLKSRVHKTAFV